MSLWGSICAVLEILNRRQRTRLTWAVLTHLSSGLMDMVGVVSILPFLMLMSNPESVEQSPWLAGVQERFGWSNEQYLMVLGTGALIMLVLNHVLRVIANWLGGRLAYLTWGEIVQGLYGHYLRQPYSFYFRHNSSVLADRMLVRSNAVVAGVLAPGIDMFARSMTMLFVGLLLFWHDPVLTLVLIGIMGGFYLGIHRFVGGRAEKYGQELAEVGPRMLKMSTETFGAIKEIKARGLEPVFKEFFRPLRQRYVFANLRQQVLTNVPPAMMEILAFGGILVIALFLIATSNNYQSLVPTLGLYVLATRRLLPSVQGILQALAQMRFYRPSLKIIGPDLAAMKIGGSDSIPRGHPLELRSKLELVGLEYSYPDTEPKVLDGITLEIESGQCVGIVGGSGAGKTTMVDLVAGLLEPTGGSVMIDGSPLDSSCVGNWQHGLGYVPQSIFLLDDTVVKNIAFGVPEQEIDMGRVREVSKLAQIGQFIEQELPEGYQTMVGERGVRLSGGQQQRLGIARALYPQPTVLVLDEATSALDGITEEQLLNALKTLTGHVTIIMVAHRLTTLKDCDVVFLLDCGRLVAQGTHARLLADCPMYARMARQPMEAVYKGEQAGLAS